MARLEQAGWALGTWRSRGHAAGPDLAKGRWLRHVQSVVELDAVNANEEPDEALVQTSEAEAGDAMDLRRRSLSGKARMGRRRPVPAAGTWRLAGSGGDGDERSRAAAGAARPWHGKNLEGMQQERENTREGEQRQGSPEHERAARTKQRRPEVAGDQDGAVPSPWTSRHGLFPVKRSERDERF